jgi:hypothetical protein
LFRVLDRGLRCWAATRPFEGKSGSSKIRFHQGSIVVPAGVQDGLSGAELRAFMEEVAQGSEITITALTSGYSGSLPNLGSPGFFPVTHPRPLVVTGSGAGSLSVGEVWHQMDQVWESAITMADVGDLSSTVLSKHGTVILTGTSFTALSTSSRSALEAWVKRGGLLIALGSSAGSVAGQEWCKVELLKTPAAAKPKAPAQHSAPYDQAAEERTGREINGVILRALFDHTHPLAYGFNQRGPEVAFFRDGTTFLKPSTSHYLTPFTYTEDPLVSGSVSKANLATLKNATPVQVRTVDSGRVILMTDNPVFRGHWLGTEKILANALFFGPQVRSTGGGAGGSDEDDEDEQ